MSRLLFVRSLPIPVLAPAQNCGKFTATCQSAYIPLHPVVFREPAMPIVKFVKEKKEIEVPEGANLRAEAVKAGINLNQGFNGFGASINKFANC